MPKISEELGIIVASPSPIVRKGIESLIATHFERKASVFSVQTTAELRHLLLRHAVVLLIIEGGLAEEQGLNWTEIKFTQPQLKTIVLHRFQINAKQGRYSHNLLLDAPEEMFYQTLDNLFPKQYENPNREHSITLSKREKEILRHMVQGVTTKKMAELLHLSHHTISTHRKNIISKLGIKTIAGLTVYAVMNGIVDLEDMG